MMMFDTYNQSHPSEPAALAGEGALQHAVSPVSQSPQLMMLTLSAGDTSC